MNIRSFIKKTFLAVMLWGLVLGINTTAYAISGGGIDLKKAGNNYGIIAQIQDETGKILTGTMFIVDNSNSLSRDAASSGNFLRPFDTINYAIGRASATTSNTNSPAANNGNLILVLPGHTNTAMSSADEIDVDLAGLTIWGAGSGADRATLTYTVAAGEFTIGAANVTIGNIRFISSVTAVLKAINVEDGVHYTKIINCEFGVDSTGTDEFNATIYFENDNTGALVEGNTIDMGLGGAVQAVHMDADTAFTTIRDNVIRGDYSTANISGDTTLSTNILIEDNLLENGIGGNLNAQPCIELLTATTGTIRNNDMVCDVATPDDAVVADTCLYFGNRYNETIDGASTAMPVNPAFNSLLGFKVTKADAALPQSTTETAFTIAGGRVLITRLTAEIGTVVETQACNLSVLINPTTGTSGTVASTLDITASEAGSIGLVEGDGSAFIMIDAGTTWAAAGNGFQPFEANIGSIDVLTSASNTGTIKWEIWYIPLEDGAVITSG